MDDEKITEEIPEDENSDRTEEPSSKILIVEDNEELRELLVRLFSKVYSVYEAQDGEEGFEKTKEVQPDIVLSDIMMPKMSGIEMCRMIKVILKLRTYLSYCSQHRLRKNLLYKG